MLIGFLFLSFGAGCPGTPFLATQSSPNMGRPDVGRSADEPVPEPMSSEYESAEMTSASNEGVHARRPSRLAILSTRAWTVSSSEWTPAVPVEGLPDVARVFDVESEPRSTSTDRDGGCV